MFNGLTLNARGREDMGLDVLKDGVLEVITEMKSNKAKETDIIPAAILRKLEENAMAELIRLSIYSTGNWLEDVLSLLWLWQDSLEPFVVCATELDWNTNEK